MSVQNWIDMFQNLSVFAACFLFSRMRVRISRLEESVVRLQESLTSNKACSRATCQASSASSPAIDEGNRSRDNEAERSDTNTTSRSIDEPSSLEVLLR